jgi:hypothetical protein
MRKSINALAFVSSFLLFIVTPTWGAIAFSHASNTTPCNNTTSCASTVTITNADTVVVTIQMDNTKTVSSVVDDKGGGSNTYTSQCRKVNSIQSVDIFTATATGAATTVTVTSSGNTDIGISIATYTGVGSIGSCSAGSTGTSAAPSDTGTLVNNADFLVTSFTDRDTIALTATTGNLRASTFCNCGVDRIDSAIFDNTGAASVTNTAAGGASFLWTAISIDLQVPVGGGNRSLLGVVYH